MFANHEPIVGTIKSVPADTGDCYFIEVDGGMEVGVQQFDYMCIYPITVHDKQCQHKQKNEAQTLCLDCGGLTSPDATKQTPPKPECPPNIIVKEDEVIK